MDSHKKATDLSWIQGSLLGHSNVLLGLVDVLRAKNLIDSESLERAIKTYEEITTSHLDEPLDERALEVMHAIRALAVFTAKYGRDELIAAAAASPREKSKDENKSKTEVDDEPRN
jgi:predicted mannosyl-3-phosphoglycerate phosphatase (HAD superfamily)